MKAQTSNLIGEYYLTDIMETASGFKLNEDSTFEFFYSYGALDRSGSGKWKLDHNKIIFTSVNHPLKDFKLVKSKKVEGGEVIIKISDPNTLLLRYVECAVKMGKNNLQSSTDDKGIAKFSIKTLEEISLVFHFCPERMSVFKVEDKTANYFEFNFESWVMDVFFDHFSLEIVGNQLIGRHPIIQGENHKYYKN